MATIAVITNPYAKLNRNGTVDHSTIDSMVNGYGLHLKTGSATDIPLAIEEVRLQGADILALNTGDGGLHKLVTEVIYAYPSAEERPLLAPMVGGTNNIVAAALDFHRPDPVKTYIVPRAT